MFEVNTNGAMTILGVMMEPGALAVAIILWGLFGLFYVVAYTVI